MSLLETVLVFVVIPGAIYGLLALLTLRRGAARVPRYRPGQEWDFPPVWWTANPAGYPVAAGRAETAQEETAQPARTAFGGARGSW